MRLDSLRFIDYSFESFYSVFLFATTRHTHAKSICIKIFYLAVVWRQVQLRSDFDSTDPIGRESQRVWRCMFRCCDVGVHNLK